MAHRFDIIRTTGIGYLKAAFGEDAVERAIALTAGFRVEVPAWQLWKGFGGGGRFDTESGGGAARNIEEIAADMGLVHRLTGATPAVSTHILWFYSDNGMSGSIEKAREVQALFVANGITTGAINTTYFLTGSGDGSFTSQDGASRKRFIDQTVLGAEIATEVGNGLLSLWWPDGTNYPGQRYLQEKMRLMREGVSAFWDVTSEAVKNKLDMVLFEYKVFEPGTYSTTIPDWGTARELARLTGDKGGVLVDMGHHHHGTNIEQIVANLIASGVRGGFHFNTRYAADDDHSVQGDYEMARIFFELVRGDVIVSTTPGRNWAYGLDQMARTEHRIPSVLKSVDALLRSVAKAGLVDTDALEAAQKSHDLIAANVAYEAALLHADTGPIVMEALHRKGLHPVPLTAFKESEYQEKVARERR
jgi:L-rhamnose isomerase / sugar isomerase